jgi:hypothetical protein
MTVIEYVRQVFVKMSFTEFRENTTTGLVIDPVLKTEGQTGRRADGYDIYARRSSLLCKNP